MAPQHLETKQMETLPQTKTCTKCGEEKKLSEYNKCKLGKYMVRPRCKDCTKEDDKKYIAENLNKRRQNSHKWQVENPEKSKLRTQRWRKNNPEKVIEMGRKYRNENPEKIYERNKKYFAKNYEKFKDRKKNSILMLDDSYIKDKIINQFSSFKISRNDITSEWINIKRKIIQTKRIKQKLKTQLS